jgi:hypothetical protein
MSHRALLSLESGQSRLTFETLFRDGFQFCSEVVAPRCFLDELKRRAVPNTFLKLGKVSIAGNLRNLVGAEVISAGGSAIWGRAWANLPQPPVASHRDRWNR